MAQEYLGARPADQVKRAHDHGSEQRGAGLEEFVARPGLDKVGEGLFGMAARGSAGRGHDLLHAAAHEGDRAGGLVIGFGSEQAEEADFTVHPALCVVFLDADIVARHAAVDTAWQRGLRNDQRRGMGKELADRLVDHQRFGIARKDVEVLVAQDAEVRALDHLRLCRQHAAFGIGGEVILAATEEDVVIFLQPFEKGDGLVAFGRRDVAEA